MRLAGLMICCALIPACSRKEFGLIPAPSISSFTSSVSTLFFGESATLTPVFSNGEGFIDQGVGAVTSRTTYAISPRTDTTYTLTVTNGAGTAVTAQLAIQVDAASVTISNFTSSPEHVNYGETTTLSWTIGGRATALTLDGVSVLGQSSQTVSPVRRQTYVLAGSNPVGGDRRSLSVGARGLDLLAGSLGGAGSRDGAASGARFDFPRGVAVDGSGNVYVADTLNHTIRKITAAGVVSTLAGKAGTYGSVDGAGSDARFHSPYGVAADGSGNVYVADTNNHTIRKITPAGVVSTLAGLAFAPGNTDGPASDARFHFPYGVAVDGSGNVYVADTHNCTIRKVSSAGVVSTVAGLAGVSGSADGIGSDARFFLPGGVATDGSGNVYVADTLNHTIRKVNSAGAVSIVAGQEGTSGTADGTGSAARFSSPSGVAVDAAGNVYVADADNHIIRKVTPAREVTTPAGLAFNRGSADGTGRNVRFYYPRGVAADASGNVYVADTYNHAIRRVTSAALVSTVAGLAEQPEAIDGTGSDARFSLPDGLAIDATGNIYVADTNNHTIRKVTSSGVVTTLAGQAGSFGFADGTGRDATFNSPSGVAVDGSGNVYVADTNNHTIRKVTSSGVVSTLAGRAGLSGQEDGAGSNARFRHPSGVAVDGSGNVFVADVDNHTIRKVTPGREVSTVAGLALNSGSTDGTAANARFFHPRAVAVDRSGNVYVSDSGNHTIRLLTPDRVVTTLAGLAGHSGTVDGAGSDARFRSPQGVAADDSGNVYVADTNNHSIRKVNSINGDVTTIAGSAVFHGILPGPLPASLAQPFGIALTPTGDLMVSGLHSVLEIIAF